MWIEERKKGKMNEKKETHTLPATTTAIIITSTQQLPISLRNAVSKYVQLTTK